MIAELPEQLGTTIITLIGKNQHDYERLRRNIFIDQHKQPAT
jgi:hypothetical protein